MTDNKTRMGERIRQARREAGLTQVELAKQLGITQGMVSAVENGQTTIDAHQLIEWSKALQKPITYFYIGLEFDDSRQRAINALSRIPQNQMGTVVKILESLGEDEIDEDT
ncbi:MAG: helix-turn-helix transcriptional regulator [Chloroflexota bacterium]